MTGGVAAVDLARELLAAHLLARWTISGTALALALMVLTVAPLSAAPFAQQLTRAGMLLRLATAATSLLLHNR